MLETVTKVVGCGVIKEYTKLELVSALLNTDLNDNTVEVNNIKHYTDKYLKSKYTTALFNKNGILSNGSFWFGSQFKTSFGLTVIGGIGISESVSA